MTDLTLASEFPAASREDWLALVQRTLKGDIDQLKTTTYDGLVLEPIYERAAAAQAIAGRAPAAPWHIVQRVDYPDSADGNAEALHELANGATGLALVFASSPAANGYGLAEPSGAAIERVLDSVDVTAIHLRLDAGALGLAAAEAFVRCAPTLALRDAVLGIDPIGAHATGTLDAPLAGTLEQSAGFAADLVRRGFTGRAFVADGRAVHDAGGSEVQELALALASAVAYLRALETAGLELDAARRQIAFLFAADADQLLTLAKFRAARKLWARVEEACSLPPLPASVHAETAFRMMTRRDPQANWLRTTVAAFAAGLGGADSIAILPYTAALGLPDRFARRIARNTQLILIEESNLHRVTDPAAGSGAIEALTERFAMAAWNLFQAIERRGGIAGALADGWLQEEIATVRLARERDVATRKVAFTGTSDFPNLAEEEPTVIVARMGRRNIGRPDRARALPRIRLAAPFERLRDASDAALARTGSRPSIFLARLGAAADFMARATFAKSLFEAGGIEAIEDAVQASPGEEQKATDFGRLAAAYRASGARIACLCGSDETYRRDAAAAAKTLRDAGATALWLIGRPAEREGEWRAAGITHFIDAGSDVLATLQAAHDILAVPAKLEDRAGSLP